MKNILSKSPIKKFLLVLIAVMFAKSTVSCQEFIKEKYIVTTLNDRINIKTITNLSGDTVFINTFNGNSFQALDSVNEYHSTRPSRGLRGFLIGAISGVTAGAIIGAASTPEPDYSNLTTALSTSFVDETSSALVGGLVGLIIGGGLGYVIGASLGEETHLYFNTMSQNKKRQILFNLIYK